MDTNEEEGRARPGPRPQPLPQPGLEGDRELFEHLTDEFGQFGSAAVGFLVTAAGLASNGDPDQQPRLGEVIAYCVREALKRILDSVERPSAGRWQSASRRVTTAKKKFEQVRGLPVGDEDGTLAELLRTIDELDAFHNEAGLHERRIIAVLVSRTGAVPVEARRDVVLEYQALIEELNTAVHESCDLESALEGLSKATRVLRRLFLPPDARLAELDELAIVAKPSAGDVARLRDAVYSPSHLEYFFGRVVSASWLDLLTGSGMVTPPEGQAPWPVYRLVENLAETADDEIARWLDDAYNRWGDDTARARHLARAAAGIGAAGYKPLLRALRDHQRDPSICHAAELALRDVAASAPIVVEVAEYLLNDQSGLQQMAGLYGHREVLRKMVEGITAQNAPDRLRLLAHKLRSVGAEDRTRHYVLGQRSGSIADSSDQYGAGRFSVLLRGFVSAIDGTLEAGVGSDIVLGSLEVLDEELRGRLRVLILTRTREFDVDGAVAEVAAAIHERLPCRDDMRLIDRLISEVAPTDYVDSWRAALGNAPSTEALAIALSDDSVDEGWLRCRQWSAILPPECTVEWKTATTLLTGAYGPVTREFFEHRPSVQVGYGRSPMTVDEIAELQPAEAATRIAAWRPSPSDWLVGPRELARTLEEAIKRDPQSWVESPLSTLGALREPIYISHYFRAIAAVDAELSDMAEELVEAVAFCRRHPWEPTVLGRSDWDYDPDWRAADQDGIAVLRKLADSDAGFGTRIEQVWGVVIEAARDRSNLSGIVPTREDPMDSAINRPCTRALEAAISLMAFEFRRSERARPEGLELLEETLRLPGWDGAEHRAIIAPRLAFLLHVAQEWVEGHASLLVGRDAPDDLGQLTVDMAVKWGRPHRWVFEQTEQGILDAVGREVENSLSYLLIGMLWGVPGYEATKLVQRLSEIEPSLLSAAGEALARLLRAADVKPELISAGVQFWEAALLRGGAKELAGFGWWSEVSMLADPHWERLTLRTAEEARGRLDWSHAVADRAAKPPVSVEGLAILNHLVRGQVDEWDRLSVIESAVQALRLAKDDLASTEEYKRLRTTLIERGRFDVKEICPDPHAQGGRT